MFALIQKIARDEKQPANKLTRRYRPGIEGLEDRISLSGMPSTPGTYTNAPSSPSPTPAQWSPQ